MYFSTPFPFSSFLTSPPILFPSFFPFFSQLNNFVFLTNTHSDYATKVFGFATFGRIYGTVICVSGAGQFIQPALDALTHGPLHNNPVPVNISFAVAGSVISTALTLFVYMQSRQASGVEERRSRQKKKNNGVVGKYLKRYRGRGEAEGTEEERRRLLSEED